MWQLLLVVGGVIGLGAAILIAELTPRQPRIAAALERLGSNETITTDAAASLEDRVGGWAQRRFTGLPGFRVPTKDLHILNRTPQTFFAQKLLLGLVGLIAPWFLALLFWVLGFPSIISGVTVIIAIPIAFGMMMLIDLSVKQQAEEARQEFARAIATYLELVAAERWRGAPAAVALDEAASVGDSWVFERIRQELLLARFSGKQPWDALSALADEIGVKELAEVGDIMRLSGEEGASVYETLRARGKSLRTQLLNDDHTVANRLSERMTFPQTALGMIFLFMLVTPALMNLAAT